MTGHYPDSVVRTRTSISQVPFSHDHQIFVDSKGNGWTSTTGSESASHRHKITGWVVQSAKAHQHGVEQPYGELKSTIGRTAKTAKNKVR